jgi:hypothetical protein
VPHLVGGVKTTWRGTGALPMERLDDLMLLLMLRVVVVIIIVA